jgi:hypothetical protein
MHRCVNKSTLNKTDVFLGVEQAQFHGENAQRSISNIILQILLEYNVSGGHIKNKPVWSQSTDYIV